MSIQKQLTSLVLAIALVGAACGGGDEPDVVAVPENDPVEVTTTVKDTAPEKDEPAPAKDEPADTTTTTTEPADTAPQVVDEGQIDIAPTRGTPLDPSFDRDQVVAALIGSMGPTDDIGSVVAALGPFGSEYITLPDTEVIGTSLTLSASETASDGLIPVESLRLEFITSASRSDAALSYATELAAVGWEVAQGEQTSGDVVFSTVDADPTESVSYLRSLRVTFRDRQEGGSIGLIKYTEQNQPDVKTAERGEGWHGNSPIPDGSTFELFSGEVSASRGGNYSLSLLSQYVTTDSVEADTYSAMSAIDSDWEFDVVEDRLDSVLFNGDDATLRTTEFDGEVTLKISQRFIVAAPTPVSPATEGTGIESGDSSDDDVAPSGPGAAGTYAEPNGTVIDASMDRATIEETLISILGPTDDLPGSLARGGLDFPAGVPTLPDTGIVSVNYTYGIDPFIGDTIEEVDDPRDTRARMLIDFVTSTAPEDVVIAYQTEMVAKGWELGRTSIDEQTNGLVVHRVSLSDPTADDFVTLSVTAFVADGQPTEVEISFNQESDSDAESMLMANGWLAGGGFPDGGYFYETQIRATLRGADSANIAMSTTYDYFDVTEADARAAALAVLGDGTWGAPEDPAADEWIVAFEGEEVRFNFNEREARDLNPVGSTNQRASIVRDVALG